MATAKEEVKTEERVDLSHLQHPVLRPTPQRQGRMGKTRRTIVRVAKLINPTGTEKLRNKGDTDAIDLRQVPIEPSHNNHGILDDPSMPLRHYMNKGWQLPHEYDENKYPFMFCAVIDCWEHATLSDPNAVVKTERCPGHEEMWQEGTIRYSTKATARSR